MAAIIKVLLKGRRKLSTANTLNTPCKRSFPIYMLRLFIQLNFVDLIYLEQLYPVIRKTEMFIRLQCDCSNSRSPRPRMRYQDGDSKEARTHLHLYYNSPQICRCFSNCRSQFLLDRLWRCLKLFISTDSRPYILSRVRVSVRPSNLYTRKTSKSYREDRVSRKFLLNAPVTVDRSPATTSAATTAIITAKD